SMAQPPRSLALLGWALARLSGDIGRAVPLLEDAQRRSPHDFWINFGLALTLQSTPKHGPLKEANLMDTAETTHEHGPLEEVIRFYTAAIAIRPRSYAAHSNLGNALNARGQLDAAIAEYREAIRLKPDYAIAHSNLGHVLFKKGQVEAAIVAHRESIRLEPDL